MSQGMRHGWRPRVSRRLVPSFRLRLPCLVALCLTLFASSLLASGNQPFQFADDFSSYPDGSDAYPTWFTTSTAWAVAGAALASSDPHRSFALVEGAPIGRRQTTECILVLGGTTNSGWKIAGVAVFLNEQNYWHFALVEAPDDAGRAHFVELREMYEGIWIAEYAAETRLTQTVDQNMGFNWSYGRPYRLRVDLTPEGITGSLEELDGTLRARCAFIFDNEAVTCGTPGLDSGGFRSEFDNFLTEVADQVEPPAKTYPDLELRSWSGVEAVATGFFRTQEIDGAWWLIDPEGRGFFVIGTDHANYEGQWCEALGYAPYRRNCEQKYGSIDAWSNSTVSRLLSWGFNAVAARHSSSLRYQGLAHIELLEMGTSFTGAEDICPKTTWTGFPDVFSPNFSRHCERYAWLRCRPNRDDPWLVGYFIDNELEWYGKSGREIGLLEETVKKDADHPAKKALLQLLKERYSTVQALNAAWGINLASFEDFLLLGQPPSVSKAMEVDGELFLRQIAERYFSIAASAIRKYDPNHLVLGCRFAGRAQDPVWEMSGTYCDVVSVNCYRMVDLGRGILADGFEDALAEWYSLARKPLMITEWSFPAMDAGLPCLHGAGQRVPTQADRALAFTVFQELLFSTPFIVGSDFFMWVDDPALGISSTFPEDSNYGLVNERDEPYQELSGAATEVNAQVYPMHSATCSAARAEIGRVVYYDPGYPTAWISFSKAAIYRSFLLANGFVQMDAEQLKAFMEGNGPDTVVVMAQDIVPDTVGDVRSAGAVIRRYLDRGGSVVWMQDVPLYYQGHADGTRTEWGTAGMGSVLGVSMGAWDRNDVVAITADGVARGLSQTWRSLRPVDPAGSRVTRVFANSSGGAAAWIKNFCPQVPSSGFIRLWDNMGDFTSAAHLADLLALTNMNPVGPLPPSAEFTFSPLLPYSGAEVAFTDSSTDLDGSIVSWKWSFGDGSTSTQQHPTHAYAAGNRYLVKLVVTDDDGLEGSTSLAVSVGEAKPDSSTLDGKVMMGYQGWFRCAGDGSPNNFWVHWFRNNLPNPANLTVDLWPDISELGDDELFATDMGLPDGSPARLYSAYTTKTVVRHFRWMKENGIDGVFLQRFTCAFVDPAEKEAMNKVVENVKLGAETHGRVFALMYDISGSDPANVVQTIKEDWMFQVDTMKVTESPQYLHHNGRPVLAIWGFGFTDRLFTPAMATEIIRWLTREAPERYRVKLMGGVPTYWRSLNHDSMSDPAWATVYRSFDIISPWSVGRYADNPGADSYKSTIIVPDLAEASALGRDYMPVVFPGFSWHNLYPSYPTNQIPRQGGKFFWHQVCNAISAGCRMIYIAMFDEVDEGTAMMKLAPTRAELPVGAQLVPLDIDGYSLPSDWYLILAGYAGRMLRKEIPLNFSLPILPEKTRDDALFISLDVPVMMEPGKYYPVSIVMKNSGTNTWTGAGGYALASQNAVWDVGGMELSPSDYVQRNDVKTFTFNVTAPGSVGTYDLQFRMDRQGIGFGESSIKLRVGVGMVPVSEPALLLCYLMALAMVLLRVRGTRGLAPTASSSLPREGRGIVK